MVQNNKDNIYANSIERVEDFIFDEKVASVFEDMINRSVPGYQDIISGIGVLSRQYAQENSVCYDLGCSLGAATLMMQQCVNTEGVSIVAVDNSEAMVQLCRDNLVQKKGSISVEVICESIQNINIKNTSVVVLNFVLQFIPVEERGDLLKKIYEGMNPKGILILSEKISFADEQEQQFLIETHQAFKKLQGYSDLEISQKRTALENVLIPESFERHKERLQKVGFQNIYQWFQCFNFISMVCIK